MTHHNGARIIEIGRKPTCHVCGRAKREASLNVIGKAVVCGFCVNQLAMATGRDALRLNAALWGFAFRYMEQDAEGTWQPKCAPEELVIAAAAVWDFAGVLVSLP